ncbi:unnamed protein product [Somion occarium]|uniref:Thiamine-binding protein domain-containing protein n=1 Tax=Somion occarium TaxID=3059160 RepID=A0ABP1DES1_9APHY
MASQDMYALADFCLNPMGTEASIAEYVAECVRVVKKSGLKYHVHGYGTNIEGPWDDVVKAVQECHVAVHAKGAPRIHTDLRIGTRVDHKIVPGTGIENQVKRVEEILAKE